MVNTSTDISVEIEGKTYDLKELADADMHLKGKAIQALKQKRSKLHLEQLVINQAIHTLQGSGWFDYEQANA